MKSIERRYKNIEARKYFRSSFICFAEAVKGQYFGKQAISHWFNKLVEKDDYAGCEKKQILKHLEDLSNPVEDSQK
jgi:hypothetical protein